MTWRTLMQTFGRGRLLSDMPTVADWFDEHLKQDK
jgi:hypothetical protein